MKKTTLFYLPAILIVASLTSCKVSQNISQKTIVIKNESSLALSQKAFSIKRENLGL